MLAEDRELQLAFLEESRDALAGLEARLRGLPGLADPVEQIQAIFRPVHTFKGTAPFFGFQQLKRLAHAMETILDQMRNRHVRPEQRLIDALIAGLDALAEAVDRLVAGGPEIADPPAFEALVAATERLGRQAQPDAVEALIDQLDAWCTRFGGAPPALAALRRELAVRGSQPLLPARQDATGGGIAGMIAGLRADLSAPLPDTMDPQRAKSVLDRLAAIKAAGLPGPAAAVLAEAMQTCDVFVSSIGFDEMLRQHVAEALRRIAAALPDQAPDAEAATPAVVEPRQPSTESRSRPSESLAKSMRVDEAAVDGFLSHVGDLLVIGDQLEHLQRRLALGEDPVALGRDMRQATAAFALLSNELQRSIMAIRRVPVRSLLQKAPRLAREVAAKAGKQVEVVLSGEDVSIDKSRVELLDGPLTHLVRNCVDHGIEAPERRRSAGKPPAGSVRIAASTGDGWFQLEIGDDGRGLDLEAIRRKGESMGLVRPGAPIDERGIVDLIFASGLSTAAQVSDVSGRGVGMDVVKRNIEDAGGSISVHTEPGRGCVFRIRIPTAVTTQIIAAYVVEEDAALYALPLDWIRESFADPGEPGPARVILRHGSGMPVGDLASALGTRRANPWPERRTVVVVRDGDGSRGLAVDRTMGVRQVVIRPLHRAVRGDEGGCFEGAALLGDGRLALVIDPRRLQARRP